MSKISLGAVAAFLALLSCSSGPECSFDLGDQFSAQESGTAFSLHDATSSAWSEVALFAEYTPAERVRSSTGHPYYPLFPPFDHVPECAVLFVFKLPDNSTCQLTWYRSGYYLSSVEGHPATDPWFIIRPVGERRDITCP